MGDEEICKNIGQYIKERRVAEGLSQEEVAERLVGMTADQCKVSRFENAKKGGKTNDICTIHSYCDALNIDLRDVLMGSIANSRIGKCEENPKTNYYRQIFEESLGLKKDERYAEIRKMLYNFGVWYNKTHDNCYDQDLAVVFDDMEQLYCLETPSARKQLARRLNNLRFWGCHDWNRQELEKEIEILCDLFSCIDFEQETFHQNPFDDNDAMLLCYGEVLDIQKLLYEKKEINFAGYGIYDFGYNNDGNVMFWFCNQEDEDGDYYPAKGRVITYLSEQHKIEISEEFCEDKENAYWDWEDAWNGIDYSAKNKKTT